MVIPAHGPGPFLAEAVASALAEGPAEVLVVEDGTQGVDEADLGGARLLRLPHVRRSRARNAGVEAAATPFVAFLDEDDLCLPGRLERQRQALEHGGELCFGRVRVEEEDGTLDDEWNTILDARFAQLERAGASFEAILSVPAPIYTSATMVRRDAFLEVGGFDPAFDAHEDLDLYLRLSRASYCAHAPGSPSPPTACTTRTPRPTPCTRRPCDSPTSTCRRPQGRARGLLLERRMDALWGLGRFKRGPAHCAARRLRAAVTAREPALRPPARSAALLPSRVLEARR